jgi:peptide chain release factor 3
MPADREAVSRRRTLAIVSHPDAGKTTLTEHILLAAGAIQLAGAVKGRRTERSARSDWMALERERGISVATSVMQFPYGDAIVNLLDTPGHEDFSEDTYRTLTAVDSVLMVLDAAKGVEPRTLELMRIVRERSLPVLTFVNKMDRDARPPLELLDEIHDKLGLEPAPLVWPLGSGRGFRGVIDRARGAFEPFATAAGGARTEDAFSGLSESERRAFDEEMALVAEATPVFETEAYRSGTRTGILFGSALHGFGVPRLLDLVVAAAPPPGPRPARERDVHPDEDAVSGFVFKIHANMDPRHHDRMVFVRLCSGRYEPGRRLRHVDRARTLVPNDLMVFLGQERERVQAAYAGDVIGFAAHGGIEIGDTFSEGEELHFRGIPNFAPTIFRRLLVRDPLRAKALLRGVGELAEEGAVQFFRPLLGNDVILGAVGPLQFDVVAYRLEEEYGVPVRTEPAGVGVARWVEGPADALARLEETSLAHLARDGLGSLVYLAPHRIHMDLVVERHPKLRFLASRERKDPAS